MDISAHRTVLPSRFPLRSVALLTILGLLLAAVVAVGVGSQQQRLPAPFGLAANGLIAYGAADGDIHAFDARTGASRSLVAGLEQDETPDFAPDGSQFVFARRVVASASTWRLMLANADGSNVRELTDLIYPKQNAWSPDSRLVAVADSLPAVERLTIYSVDGTAPVDLPVDLTIDHLRWRSPSELVFFGSKAGTYGLYVVGIDGSLPRPILPVSTVDSDWLQPVVSPDGSQVSYTRWGDSPMIHVVDIDTGIDRQVQYDGANEGDGWPSAWSPDGGQLVFTRWDGTENHLAVGSVNGGPATELGPGFPDFTNGAIGLFSPDGRQIVARYGQHPDEVWLLDVAGGPGERVLTQVPQIGSWQRRAP